MNVARMNVAPLYKPVSLSIKRVDFFLATSLSRPSGLAFCHTMGIDPTVWVGVLSPWIAGLLYGMCSIYTTAFPTNKFLRDKVSLVPDL
jgi:hypothetical protein